MTSDITIRPFRGNDTAALLECWNLALPLDGITLTNLERKVLLDQNFEEQSLQVAVTRDGSVAGFITCFILNKPIEKVGHRPEAGFVTAFGVRPEHRRRGAGSGLMNAAEAFFVDRGRRQILLAPYTPNYFVPGVDKDRYPEGVRFLQDRGFTEYSEALAADALISTFELDAQVLSKERELAADGIVVRPYRRNDLVHYMQFQRELMPGPWIEDARRNLLELADGRFHEDAIWLAVDESQNRIIGFCQHEHEHFGPFGVSDAYQGKGIGTVLLARTMYQMRLRGCHSAWVLWTGERALKGVYGRLGFKLTRRFAIMKKEIQHPDATT
jgi:GNAT superfamily N-acetyltransferase